MARRLEPTVFLAMVSPITVGLVAGVAALTLVAGGPVWLAVILGVVAYFSRIAISRRIARRVAALPRRIDPFALREPWRFFVRDAIQAQSRFTEAFHDTPEGPLRDRLAELRTDLDRGVEECWEAAQRGQQLTDARREIDAGELQRQLDSLDAGSEAHRAVEAQLASRARLHERETATQQALEALDIRFDEAVARAIELGTRQGDPELAESAVSSVVADLEALRLGLDDIGIGP